MPCIELPSKDIHELNVSIDYAREKLEKANIRRLKAA